MRRGKLNAVILGAAALAVLAGVYAGVAGRRERIPATTISPEAIAQLFETRLDDSTGKSRHLVQWRGQTLVVNFWATWCEPCRDEMPALSRLNERFSPNGVNFIGIALDTPSNVAQFAKKMAISYPLLIAGPEGIELSQALGNKHSALPYTVVLGPRGDVLLTRLGRVSEAELTTILQDPARP